MSIVLKFLAFAAILYFVIGVAVNVMAWREVPYFYEFSLKSFFMNVLGWPEQLLIFFQCGKFFCPIY